MKVPAGFDVESVPSPCFVVDVGKIESNLQLLKQVKDATGCKVLLALKAFAMWSIAPLVSKYLDGTCASSAHELRLGAEEYGGETHVYAPGYSDRHIADCLKRASHISFNSLSQWQRFRKQVQQCPRNVSCGLRINPEYSEAPATVYDPCAAKSRFGIIASELSGVELDREGIEGLHFHSLCEQMSGPLERTLAVVEEKFGRHLEKMKWINFGGGHWITQPDYDRDHLCQIIQSFRDRYPHLTVYLEPGEAVAINSGILVSTVLDLLQNQGNVAVIDASASAHVADSLEMPFRVEIAGSGQPGEFEHDYRIGGLTCLSGDIFGDYSFPEPLEVGQRIVALDMAHYTMVKTTNFNGIELPAIATFDPSTRDVQVIKRFGYEDYRNRLS